MNKHAEILEKQNPDWTEQCKICGHKNKFKTKDILKSNKDYTFICAKCGEKNTMKNIPAMIKSFEKQTKQAGIKIN